MTAASHIGARQRCTMLLRNEDTQEVSRCARWLNHQSYHDHNGDAWDHMSKEQVLGTMTSAVIIASGESVEDVWQYEGTLLAYTFAANDWYRALVLVTEGE